MDEIVIYYYFIHFSVSVRFASTFTAVHVRIYMEYSLRFGNNLHIVLM